MAVKARTIKANALAHPLGKAPGALWAATKMAFCWPAALKTGGSARRVGGCRPASRSATI